MAIEKDKANQATKVMFQDGFYLAKHQVLAKYPDLDISFLAGLDIPEGPRWTWSKIEHLNLPFALPSAPKVVTEEVGGEVAQDDKVP